jgi:phosphoribosylformylglycinamidine cyclo-ligase
MDYRDAGVDIDAAEQAKARIGPLARRTFTPGVLSDIGSFGGMFRPDLGGYREPVLVASTDGVGTKVKVAAAARRNGSVGHDIVNHCVNDILVQGAVPLFFLDYLALGRMDPALVEEIVGGVAAACADVGMPLLGGETAEMPDVYEAGQYDLAGFIVGVVERECALTGERVRAGDHLLGLPSSGLHTNGYTLARRVLLERLGLALEAPVPELGTTLAEALLAPHRSYLGALEPLLERGKLAALAHITGGGFSGNLPRVLPRGLGARLQLSSWTPPPLFRLIQAGGGVTPEEMYRTFNMGIGMVAVVSPSDLHEVEHSLERRGEAPLLIGTVVEGAGVTFE